VYHDAEHSISYCLGVHNSFFPFQDKSNPHKAYEFFLQKVVSALNELGVPAEVHDKNYIRVNGKKVSGNALVMSRNGLVLHGSLLIDIPDEQAYIDKVLKYVNLRDDSLDDWNKDMRGLLTSVRTYSQASRDDIVEVLARHLAPINILHSLTSQEQQQVLILSQGKYSSPHWKEGSLMTGLCWRKYGASTSQTRGVNPDSD